jgi:hypothetical protein
MLNQKWDYNPSCATSNPKTNGPTHHTYVQDKKDPMRQWLPMNYILKMEDVNLIINDWEEEWKSPLEKTGLSKEEDDQDKSDNKLSDNQGKY